MNAFVVSVILHIATVYGYDFICPDRSHLRIYSKAACKNPLDFTCLKDVIANKSRTDCFISRPIAPGYKYVFRINFDAEECDSNRYQPFVFERNKQTDCFYIKSACNEEGQVMYSHGSTTSDIKCKCEEKSGFTYVTQPRNKLFCVPSEEDCSCYRKTNNAVANNEPYATSRPNLTVYINETLIGFPAVSRVNVTNDFKEAVFSNKTKACIFVAVMLVIIIVVGVGVIFWFFVAPWPQEIDDNNKENYPSAIYKMDEESREVFKNALKSGYEIKREIRVIVVGKKEAGKTSLIRRLRSKAIKGVQATDGIEIHSLICNVANEIYWQEKTHTPDSRLLTCTMHTEKENYSDPDDGSKIKKKRSEQSDNKRPDSENKLAEMTPQSAEGYTEVSEGAKELLAQSNKKDEILKQHETEQTEKTSIHDEQHKAESGEVNKHFRRSGTEQTENSTVNVKKGTKENKNSSSDLKSKERDDKSIGRSNKSAYMKTNTIQHNKDYENIKDMATAEKIDEGDIRISVWDFGGDEEFYYTHQLFLAEEAVYLIVTSLAPSDDSSDKEYEFGFWFDTIHCLCENIKTDKLRPRCIVVGTKADLCQKKNAEGLLDEKLRFVPRALRKHIFGRSFLISNKKSDDKAITDIKVAILGAAKEGKEWETKHPLKFILLDKDLDKKRHELETRPVMNLTDIQNMNDNLSQPLTKEELDFYLRYNHLAGHLIYYEDIPGCIIIVPQWLGDLFRCIVTADKFRPSELPQYDLNELRSTGKITDTLLKDIFLLKKIDVKLQSDLMKIMVKFHIVIQLSQSNEDISNIYFAPCMVRGKVFDAENFSKENNIKDKSTWLCLECNFIPPFLFNHIIVSFCEEYRGVGDLPQFYSNGAVLDISTDRSDKLVILKLGNIIQLQIMMLSGPKNREKNYIRSFLFHEMKELTKTFSMRIKYNYKWKCPESLNKCSGLMKMDDCREGGSYPCSDCAIIHIFHNYWEEDTKLRPVSKNESTTREREKIGGVVEIPVRNLSQEQSQIVLEELEISHGARPPPIDSSHGVKDSPTENVSRESSLDAIQAVVEMPVRNLSQEQSQIVLEELEISHGARPPPIDSSHGVRDSLTENVSRESSLDAIPAGHQSASYSFSMPHSSIQDRYGNNIRESVAQPISSEMPTRSAGNEDTLDITPNARTPLIKEWPSELSYSLNCISKMKRYMEVPMAGQCYDNDRSMKCCVICILNKSAKGQEVFRGNGMDEASSFLQQVSKRKWALQLHKNKTKQEMEDILNQEMDQDFSCYSSLMVIIVSGGFTINGCSFVCGTDGGSLDCSLIRSRFEQVVGLKGKPKIFIIDDVEYFQDSGFKRELLGMIAMPTAPKQVISVLTPSPASMVDQRDCETIPDSREDTFTCLASTLGRSDKLVKGSWVTAALISILCKKGSQMSFQEMMTEVQLMIDHAEIPGLDPTHYPRMTVYNHLRGAFYMLPPSS